jgi:hypothetical protein
MPVSERELTIPVLAEQNYLRYDQRQELERSSSAVREVLDNPAMRAEAERDGADLESMEQQYHREREMLERGTPPSYDSQTKNKLNRVRRHLEEEMVSTALSRDEMERGTPENVDKYFQWHYGQYNGDQKMRAYRTILQILDPNNGEPNFLSLSRLRAKVGQSPRRNLPAFRDNFDEIKWEEVLEEDLIRDMDNDEYQKFLELRLLDWTRPSICKELSWTAKQYEAAMERVRNSRGIRSRRVEPEPEPEAQPEAQLRPYDPILDKEVERVPGWPREEIKILGMTNAEFIRQSGIRQEYFYKYSHDDSWPEHYRRDILVLLDRLKSEATEHDVEDDVPVNAS